MYRPSASFTPKKKKFQNLVPRITLFIHYLNCNFNSQLIKKFARTCSLQSRWSEDEHVGINSTRRALAKRYKKSCMFFNAIDACWRCQADWEKKRRKLAKCALGFGRGTTGGKAGRKYLVTDPTDNDMVNPKPGTLRHAVIQLEPLWIVFAHPVMVIRLNQELIMTSNKTIDGRGSHVVIEGGAGITVQYVENVIIHGIRFVDIVPGSGGMIRDSVNHYGFRTESDGDAISIFGSHHVWIDHCSFSKAADGIIDVIKGSTAVTISNCHMTNHDKVLSVRIKLPLGTLCIRVVQRIFMRVERVVNY